MYWNAQKPTLCARTILLGVVVCSAAMGAEWQFLTPCARRSPTMITDTLNHRLILFGGTDDYLLGNYYGDLWQMPLDTVSGYRWIPMVASGTAPHARCNQHSVYDPTHERMLMFGGGWGSTNIQNDVWSLDLTAGSESWTQLHPTGTPPIPRGDGYMVHSLSRNSLIIFGGYIGTGVVNDLWELKLDSLVWHEIVLSGSKPDARASGGTVLDRSGNRMLIFGGYGPAGYFGDLWALDLTPGNEHWTQLSPGGSAPAARSCPAWVGDIPGTRLYIFGGIGSSLFNDIYKLDVPSLTWEQLNPSGSLPNPRRNASAALDPFNGNFVTFGGDMTGYAYLSETDYINVGMSGMGQWATSPLTGEPELVISSPATDAVRIRYFLTHPGKVDIRILDVGGRLVRDLYSGISATSNGSVSWDQRNVTGRTVPTGTYYCLLQSGRSGITREFVVVR